MWLDWEDVIIHYVLDTVFFCLVLVLVQVICVQPVVHKPYGSIFVLGWVVAGVWDDSVCESESPVYGYLPVCRVLEHSDVQVVYFVVSLCLCRKF